VSKKYVITEQKDHSGWWVILVAAFLVAYGKEILAIAVITGAIYLAYRLWKWDNSRQRVKQVEEIPAWQDAPTRLLTEGMRVWGDPEHYLNDHNDGMREWA
jgi:hypothetical protein